MFIQKQIIFYLAVTVSLFGCVQKGNPYQQHSSAKVEPTVDAKKYSSPGTSELLNAAAHSSDPKILRELAKEILNTKYLGSFQKRNDEETSRKLWRLNQEIIQIYELHQQDSYSDTINEYIRFLYEGCSPDLNRCTYINEFFKARNLADLLVLMAKETSDVNMYYRHLRTALMVKNRNYDASLIQLILARSKEYLIELGAQGDESRRRFVQLMSLAGQMVLKQRDSLLAKQIAEQLDLNDQKAISLLSENGFSKDLSFALVSLGGGLSASTVSQYFESQTSIKDVQNRLLSTSQTAKLLGLVPISEWDELTYIIDRTFLGEVTTDQGLKLISNIKIDREHLAERLTAIYKLRFLEALTRSTAKAKELFLDVKISDDAFLLAAIRSGAFVKPIWSEFTSRSNNFQKLALVSLFKAGQEDKIIKDLRLMFENKYRNIKYMSVYPQMMALSYHMAKRDASVIVEWGHLNFSVESAQVIENLFTGFYAPWFDYAEDEKPLTMIETIYAFDFALRTGFLEAFDVNPDDFMFKIIEKLSRRATVDLRDFMQLLEQRSSTSGFTWFRHLCKQLKTNSLSLNTSLKGFRASPLLGDLNEVIFNSITARSSESGNKNEKTKYHQGLSIFDDTFNSVAEEARVDLGNIQSLLSAMLASYKSYLEMKQDTQIEEHTKASQDQLNLLEDVRVKFFKKAVGLFRELDSCYSELYSRDEAAKISILKIEAGFFRQVYFDIKSAREGKLTLEALKKKYKLSGLPDGFTGLDKIDLNGYTAYSPDGLIRAARHMNEGAQFDTEKFAPVAPGVNVQLPSRMDATAPFLKGAESTYLPFDVGLDEFVKRGIAAFIGGRRGQYFASWYYLGSGRIIAIAERQHAAAILYRLSDKKLLGKICDEPNLCEKPDQLISSKTVLDQHETYLHFARIDDDEREIMKAAGLYFKVEPIYFTRRLAEFRLDTFRITRIWGLFDLPMHIVTRDILGLVHELNEMSKWGTPEGAAVLKRERFRHISYKELAQAYFDIREHDARTGFYFQPTSGLDQTLDASVSNFVKGEVGRIRAFSKDLDARLAEVETRPADQRPLADINLGERLNKFMLTPTIYSSFEYDLMNFNMKTDNCFSDSQAGTCESFK